MQKASKQLGVLKRIGRFLTKQGKLTIYNSFIVAKFYYCPLVWHFCGNSSTNKLEKVQKRALWFMNNDFTSSIQALISSTNTEPLHVKRLKPMATEVFKIIKDLFCIQNSPHNFRNENKAIPPRVNSTVYGLRSVRYEAVRIWNSLPNELRKAESLPQFKRLIHAGIGPILKCPFCSD